MKRLLPALCLLSLVSLSPAADWPAWRGPDRTAVSKETGLLKTWPAAGPKLVWTSNVAGQGYAGIAVVGGVVYTMGARDKNEYVMALDSTGKELWSALIGPVHDWSANAWSHGPNATPTVDGDFVYALGSKGDLVCVTKQGKPGWRLNLPKELSADVNDVQGGIPKFGWGFSWSPLVDGDTLVIAPGGPKGLLAALNKTDGKVIWQSKDVTDPSTYSSPIAATIGGVKQYVYVTQQSVVGIAAKNGDLLWTHKREEPYPDVVCPTPVIDGDRVYVSVGFGGGCDCLKITSAGTKFTVKVDYSLREIASRLGGVVRVGEYVYGFNEDRSWACQDINNGKIVWQQRSGRLAVKAGGVIAAEDRLYVLDEVGTVAMLDASPKAFKVISKFKLPEQSKLRKPRGGLWTHPVLSDGKLYLRDQELVFCYQVK